MATSNPTLTTSWAKIVDSGDEFTFGLQPGSVTVVAIAAVDTDTDPAVAGHFLMSPGESINRALIGPGYVYAKVESGSTTQGWLHAWTP